MRKASRVLPLSDPDLPSLESLFKEYYDRLVFFSFQIVHDRYQAQDIAQEAFIKYWAERETVSAYMGAVKSYLYASVRNASLNAVRHNKVVQGYMESQDQEEADESNIMEAMITAEILAEIHQAIESLPGVYRKICTLSYLEGMNNQKISEELGISVNTIKKQKQKVLQLLRLKLTFSFVTLLIYFAGK